MGIAACILFDTELFLPSRERVNVLLQDGEQIRKNDYAGFNDTS